MKMTTETQLARKLVETSFLRKYPQISELSVIKPMYWCGKGGDGSTHHFLGPTDLASGIYQQSTQTKHPFSSWTDHKSVHQSIDYFVCKDKENIVEFLYKKYSLLLQCCTSCRLLESWYKYIYMYIQLTSTPYKMKIATSIFT